MRSFSSIVSRKRKTHARTLKSIQHPRERGLSLEDWEALTEQPFHLLPGHRAHTVYVGVHLPGERRHRRHHKHHHSQRQSYPCGKEDADNDRPSKSTLYVPPHCYRHNSYRSRIARAMLWPHSTRCWNIAYWCFNRENLLDLWAGDVISWAPPFCWFIRSVWALNVHRVPIILYFYVGRVIILFANLNTSFNLL